MYIQIKVSPNKKLIIFSSKSIAFNILLGLPYLRPRLFCVTEINIRSLKYRQCHHHCCHLTSCSSMSLDRLDLEVVVIVLANIPKTIAIYSTQSLLQF